VVSPPVFGHTSLRTTNEAEKLSLVGCAVARLSQGHLTPTLDRRALPLVGTSTIITSNTGINSRLGMGGADLPNRIVAYPNVSFTIVINPFNGPGLDDLPDANYQREIPRLACHPNVKVVGYIHTTWAKRDLKLVLGDIEKYAAWPARSGIPDLKVSGVFVDETPNIYDAAAEEYLDKLQKHAKRMPGGDENVVRRKKFRRLP
jgi:Spherulation-specific family 4